MLRPLRDALLYEPEGTLYAIALGGPMTIDLRRRVRTINQGDAIVVPQGQALEVEPAVDFLAVSCEGSSPDHFRERFIQVWGYDHFPVNPHLLEPGDEQIQELIPRSDLRFQVSYSVWEVPSVAAAGVCSSETDLMLLLPLDRPVDVELGTPATPLEIPLKHVLGIGPGTTWQPSGGGRLGCLRLTAEPIWQARRALQRAGLGKSFTPEVVPRSYNPPDSDWPGGFSP